MNFKMHHIQIIFKNKEILFYLDNQEVRHVPYSCEMFQDKVQLNKENFDALYEVLEKEIKNITKGFIFRPTLSSKFSASKIVTSGKYSMPRRIGNGESVR